MTQSLTHMHIVVYNITSAASKSVGAVSVDTLIRQNHGELVHV